MATAHLSVKVGKAGKGTPHAEYISRLGKYAQRLEQGEKLEFCESGNLPEWAQKNPLLFWQAADQFERKNGYVYREHEIALPRELSPEQRAELVRDWVRQELGDCHAYTWAIHNKIALDGGEQPHVHLMFSERTNDGIQRDPEQYFKRYNAKNPDRGGAKKHSEQGTFAERKAALQEMRSRWERLHNAHLEKHGFDKNHISMNSLSAQGIDRKAEPHMTPSESAALHRKAIADRLTAEVLRESPIKTEPDFRQPEPEKTTQDERHFLEIFNDFKNVNLQINKLSREQENAKEQLEALKDKRETVRLEVWDCYDEYEARKQQKSGLFGLVRNRDDERDLDKIYNKFNYMKQEYTQLDERIQTAEQDYQRIERRVSGSLKPLFEQYELIKQAFNNIPMSDFERSANGVEAQFKQLGKGADYKKMHSKQYDDIQKAGYTGEFAEKLHRSFMVVWGVAEIPKIQEQQQKALQKQQETSLNAKKTQKKRDDWEMER